MGGGVGIADVVVDCGVEGGAAELGLSGSLGLEQLHGLRCHPGVAAGLPHVRRADV